MICYCWSCMSRRGRAHVIGRVMLAILLPAGAVLTLGLAWRFAGRVWLQ